MFAQRLGAFVAPERVAEVWGGVASLFREYGYRRSRNHARFKFLVKDWGAERVRRGAGDRSSWMGRCRTDRPPGPRATAARDHVGVSPQHDGRVFVGFAPRAGRIAGHQLRLVADLADAFGNGSVRATAQQKLVMVDVDPARVDDVGQAT